MTNKSIKDLYKYNDNNKLSSPDAFIYTDGSCINNGKPNAISGYGIHYSNNHLNDISEPIVGDEHTNNIAELTALIVAIKSIIYNITKYKYTYIIFTDSEYVLRVIYTFDKTYGSRIKKNKDIPNLNLVLELHNLYELYKANITIYHIDAHTSKNDIHSIGNEKADELAKNGVFKSSKYKPLTHNSKYNSNVIDNNKKIYIKVPYTQKDNAKKLGALWDFKRKSWYIFENHDIDKKKQLLQLFS
jgi:ribonuclease HI